MSSVHTRPMSRRAFTTSLAAGAALGAGGAFHPQAAQAADAGEVVVLGWTAYWSPQATALLKAKTGLTLRIIGADTDQTIFTKLKAGGGDQYDLAYADAGWTPLYHKFGLIEPISVAEIAATKNLYSEFLTTTSLPFIIDANKTLLLYPNMWSPLAMVWALDTFKATEPPTWAMFWDKAVPKGSAILAGGSGDDFLAVGGLACDVPRDQVYSMNAAQLKQVVAKMRALKPFQMVVSDEAEYRARFRRGDATIGLTPQLGTAAIINTEAKKTIATAAIPKEGSVGWVDGPMLVKNAKNRANAIAFLNFIGSDVDYGRIIFENTGSSPCSRTVTEALLVAGGANSQMIKTIQADKPEIAAQIVLQAPPADPNAYAQAWDEVLAT